MSARGGVTPVGGRRNAPDAAPRSEPRPAGRAVDFLAVGHLTLDVTPEPGRPHGRVRPGGAVAYAALTARALGLRAAVVTGVGPGYPLDSVLRGVPAHVVPSEHTTFFQNIYYPGPAGEPVVRRQVVGGRAAPVTRADVPAEWLRAPIVFLGPLVREVPVDAGEWFPGSAVGAAAQGWLRDWDAYGRVTTAPGPPAGLSRGLRLVVGSAAELGGEAAAWAGHAEVVALTMGSRGCRLLAGGRSETVPAYAADEVDPTGAGDVWAAACLIRLVETGDPREAARFANAAASLSVEAVGLAGVPSRSDVEARLRRSTA